MENFVPALRGQWPSRSAVEMRIECGRGCVGQTVQPRRGSEVTKVTGLLALGHGQRTGL